MYFRVSVLLSSSSSSAVVFFLLTLLLPCSKQLFVYFFFFCFYVFSQILFVTIPPLSLFLSLRCCCCCHCFCCCCFSATNQWFAVGEIVNKTAKRTVSHLLDESNHLLVLLLFNERPQTPGNLLRFFSSPSPFPPHLSPLSFPVCVRIIQLFR